MDTVEVISRQVLSGGFTPYGRINLDPVLYEADFIGTNLHHPVVPLHKVHHFLHEMAHSWQHFAGMLIVDSYRRAAKDARDVLKGLGYRRRDYSLAAWRTLKFRSMYSYDITAGTDLMDFTMEQQCEIIADYYALTLWSYRDWHSKHFGHPHPTAAQLGAVLSQFRRDSSYPRDARRMNELRARYRALPR